MEEQTTGVGSLWNKNSWHWEEKNYTEWAKKRITELVLQIVHQHKDPAVSVKLYELKSIEGEASVTIRKQKQIFLYDFEMEVYFEAQGEGGQEAKGKMKVHDFN